MSEQISRYLDSLARDECYRVDGVLKESAFETTERVWFTGANGSEQGPYIRKRFRDDSGLGGAYVVLHEAHMQGRRFMHLPCVLDCYRAGEQRVAIMEYVWGETLSDVVYRCDPSLALAADLFPRICDAAIELHEGFSPPLIHRDLKPSNVIVSASGVFLIDFGIAREYKADAEADTCHFGTRGFAPPEQFGYGQTDVRSDVYALGLLLFFCLTERMPDAAARNAGFFDARIPEALRRVIERAAAFDPAARYATVRELKGEALRAIASLSPSALAAKAASAANESASEPSAAVGAPAPGMAAAANESAPAARTAAAAAPAARAPETAAAAPAAATAPASAPAPAAAVRSGAAAAVRKAARGVERLRGALSRVPVPVGAAWDVLLLATFALIAAVSASVAVSPDPNEPIAGESLAYRVVAYASLSLLAFAPALYALRDRRPVARALPHLPQFSRVVDALIAVAGFVAMVAVMAALELFGV